MSRDDGFAVMDVSTDILNDPKFRKLQRLHPELVGQGCTAYLAVMAESWKAGRRLPLADAWPAVLAFDPAVERALVDVGLLDRKSFVPQKVWDNWFTPAFKRREATRERWRRANENRANGSTNNSAQPTTDTPRPPRGSNADTGAIPSVPSVPSESIPPIPPQGGGPRRKGRRRDGTSPRQLDEAAERAKRERASQRQLAYLRHLITAEQLDEMNRRDAPLDELPPAETAPEAPAEPQGWFTTPTVLRRPEPDPAAVARRKGQAIETIRMGMLPDEAVARLRADYGITDADLAGVTA